MRKCRTCGVVGLPAGKWYCAVCKPLAIERRRINQAKYAASPKGKAIRAAYQSSETGKLVHASVVRNYRQKHSSEQEFIDRTRANQARYRSSFKGKIYRNRQRLRYYYRLNHVVYASLLSVMPELVCYFCFQKAEQIDHVLPVALAKIFNIDPDPYCAPICIECHKCKSRLDMKDIRRLKAVYV